MKQHFPLFYYPWVKLIVLLMVCIQLNELVLFFNQVTTPTKASFVESVYKANAKWCIKNQRWCK